MTRRQRRMLNRGRRSARRLRKSLKKRRRDLVCQPDRLLNRRKRGRYRFPVPGVRTMEQWDRYKDTCTHRTVKNLEPIVAAQRKIAHELGCGYFDAYRYMGGRNSIRGWACHPDERLAMYDLVHLTRAGYERLADAIGQALRQTNALPSKKATP